MAAEIERLNLGLGFGKVHIYDDGTVEYVKGLTTVMKVRAQDVTGFTVSRLIYRFGLKQLAGGPNN